MTPAKWFNESRVFVVCLCLFEDEEMSNEGVLRLDEEGEERDRTSNGVEDDDDPGGCIDDDGPGGGIDDDGSGKAIDNGCYKPKIP